MSSEFVLVTGATGFLASHIIKQLLELGYRVRGSVRSKKDEKKVAPLRKLVENPKYPLELVEADLSNESSWIDAVKDCTIVIHTASPVPKEFPDNENEVIKPAVDGTLNVFKACVLPGSLVKRVVLTSSVAAIAGDNYKNGYTFTEADWGDPNTATPYTKSKILAERAAWNFLEERKRNNLSTFELAVINPGFIVGPIFHGTFCASMEPIKRLLDREMPILPDISVPICDVRDTALAHIKAITEPNAVSQRHIIATSSKTCSVQDYAFMLKDEFEPKGYRIVTTVAPNCLLKIYGLFDRTVRMVTPFLGKRCFFSNERYINVLGITPIEVKKSINDMAYTMIERGFVRNRLK